MLRQMPRQVDQPAGELHRLPDCLVVKLGNVLWQHTHAAPPAVVLGQCIRGRMNPAKGNATAT
jgi:hypothetical protein